MTNRPDPISETDRAAVARELEKILASREFAHAERLSGFLRYVVERALSEPPNPPKEHEVALDVFGRGDDFDSRIDSIVRVQANRLRAKLAEYYQRNGGDTPIVIEIPAGGYAAVFQKRAVPAPEGGEGVAEAGGSRAPRFVGRPHLVSAVAAACFVAGLWLWRSREPRTLPAPEPEPIPLTTYEGREGDPSLSPDGAYVAFTWQKAGSSEIYVQRIGSSDPVRLTRERAPEFGPAWSPDGRWIAYFRGAGPTFELHLVTPMGERGPKVAAVRGSPSAAWSPDGRWLVVSDTPSAERPSELILISVATRERRRLTAPAGNVFGDYHPALSPDGRSVAFVRGNAVMVLGLSASLEPASEPRRVFSGDPAEVTGLVWMPGGRELLLCGKTATFESRLWRVPSDGSAPPRRLSHTGAAGLTASLARSSASGRLRLVYAREIYDSDIWRLQTQPAARAPAPFIASTRNDSAPQYSPDGRKIAFASDRSGSFEVWVGDHDGSNQTQLTRMNGYSATPRWSPDGGSIAFDSLVEGQWEVFVTGADGGPLRRITRHPALDAIPSWSRDGRFIYFTSDRTGEFQVWKAPALGGDPVQVTRSGGHVAFESFDGQLLYYTKQGRVDSALWSVPVSGGPEQEVLKSVSWRGFAPVRDGVWFLSRDGAMTRIRFHRFARGVLDVGLTPGGGPGLAVSPDGTSVLFTQRRMASGDLMLAEDFR